MLVLFQGPIFLARAWPVLSLAKHKHHSDPDFQSQALVSTRVCRQQPHVFIEPPLHSSISLPTGGTEKAMQFGWASCTSRDGSTESRMRPFTGFSPGCAWESPGELPKDASAESQSKPVKAELRRVRFMYFVKASYRIIINCFSAQ